MYRIRFPEIWDDIYFPDHPLMINYRTKTPDETGTTGIDAASTIMQIVTGLTTVMVILFITVLVRGL